MEYHGKHQVKRTGSYYERLLMVKKKSKFASKIHAYVVKRGTRTVHQRIWRNCFWTFRILLSKAFLKLNFLSNYHTMLVSANIMKTSTWSLQFLNNVLIWHRFFALFQSSDVNFVFKYNISLVWWEINSNYWISRVNQKKIKSSRKEYVMWMCFKFWPMKNIFRKL